MVKESTRSGLKIFVCEVCDLAYLDKKTAERCQEWCSTHNSCSIEITRKAVTR